MKTFKTQKYLNQYSEPQAKAIALRMIEAHSQNPYEFVLAIPAYREDVAFFLRLKNTLLKAHRTLLIIVINQPNTDKDVSIDTQKNQQLWDSIGQHCQSQYYENNYQFLHCHCSGVLLIDQFSEGLRIPEKQGVGLARKMACDIACELIVHQLIRYEWIFTTDADTSLPENYFLALQNNAQTQHSAAVYDFKHQGGNTAISEATKLYEKSLNYYVAALQWAGSRYGFHTIGSCIAIKAQAYMQARGYPKRAGGEDFYLLNKLAKLGEILRIKDCILAIDARLSDRVPFGTGPAVEKILQAQDYNYYHPQVFKELKALLTASELLFNYRHKTQQWLGQLSPQLQWALAEIGIEGFFNHLNTQIKTAEQCKYHWHDWLDGFKTLKLIHALEAHYPKLPLTQAIDKFAELQANTH